MSDEDKSKAIVKNPLTVIAVFAGLAEVSATVALPQLDQSIQATFVWFVMLFPVMLVGLFFLLLWTKHHVLYAPSDYSDEGNFMQHWVKSTPTAINEQDADEPGQEVLELPAESDGNGDEAQITVHSDVSKRLLASERFADMRVAEELVIRRLSEKLGLRFVRDMALKGRNDVRYDAIAESPSGPIFVEVKLVSTARAARMLVRRELERFAAVSYRLSKEEIQGGKLLLGLVLRSDADPDERESLEKWLSVEKQRSNLPVSVEFEIFSFEKLKLGTEE